MGLKEEIRKYFNLNNIESFYRTKAFIALSQWLCVDMNTTYVKQTKKQSIEEAC